MREIKCRGFTEYGEEVKGYYCQVGDKHCIVLDDAVIWEDHRIEFIQGFIEVLPETVGQFTGLHDKNGKEIYGEGDIYKDADGIISIVEMAVDGWALFPIKKETLIRNLYWHNVCDKTKGEVIGNIHESPGLLKEQSDET